MDCFSLAALLGDECTPEEFFGNYFERRPLLVRRKKQKNAAQFEKVVSNVFSRQALSEAVDKAARSQDPVCYGRDMTVCRYECGRKVLVDPQECLFSSSSSSAEKGSSFVATSETISTQFDRTQFNSFNHSAQPCRLAARVRPRERVAPSLVPPHI